MTELQEQAATAANRHIIERPRLTSLLDETSARVIMLVAPAGYGKTTLARQWLGNKQRAWYSARRGADMAAVGIGLLEAAEDGEEDVGNRFRQWLLAQRKPSDFAQAAEFLSADLATFSSTTWLAIDDYHQLSPEAEELIDRLRSLPHLRFLLTTRRRPMWCTPRDLIYDDVLEIDRSSLSMNDHEAGEVLRHLGQDAADVVAIADGWPAVIGLASFARESPRLGQGTLPPELYAYIADELYATLDPSVRDDVACLGLFLSVSPQRASSVLPRTSELAIAEALRVGFLTEDGSASYRFHPLLRSFLLRKLRGSDTGQLEHTVSRAVEVMLADGEWENALEVSISFGVPGLLVGLIEAALYDLLGRGLVSTITKITSSARAAGISAPILTLAEAEVASREGIHERSKCLAEIAGAQMTTKPSLATKAFCRAGQSAYFLDETPSAVANFARARELATTRLDKRDAQWGLFLTAVEQESADAEALLADFETLCQGDPEDVLRLQNGRLHFGMRIGSNFRGLFGAEAAAAVATEGSEPVIRISFWHVYAGALRLAAAYDEALVASDVALSEVDTFDLTFARAHVNLTRSAVYTGLGLYAEALALLKDVAAVARQAGDVYLQMSERALRCRTHLLDRDIGSATAAVDGPFAQMTSSGQYSELLSLRALIRGMTDDRPEGLALLEEARRASNENEAVALNSCVAALLELHQEDFSLTEFASDFEEYTSKGVLDPFVLAFRLEPRLTQAANRMPKLRPKLRELLARLEIAERGVHRVSSPLGSETLTRREREVFTLIGQGKTNREIATALFLAESTVKVHVRHILRKLGVRTRTEAAIQAVKRR
jgi:ATP/maltotriose-dependent transcriptional regulator MalT